MLIDRSARFSKLLLRGIVCAALAMPAVPAVAQLKTGPDIAGDDALTWHGITLYGVIDVGLQYDTHGAPFSDYRPAASANIVQKNSRQSVLGATPSNEGQSRVGLQGLEPLGDGWSAVFRVETFFNPQSGELADSVKSLVVNNGRTPATQTTNLDGSSAGQALQTAYVGATSAGFGTFTFGRQLTLLAEGTIKYDPNQDASAFGLIGASNTYSGGGSTEDKRLDSTLKYLVDIGDHAHLGALYKFNGATGSAGTAIQGNLGAHYAGISVDAYYSKVNDAISASALSAAQVAQLPKLGYSGSNSVAATISDNTAFALLAAYRLDSVAFFAGYEHIRYSNPKTSLSAGYTDIGGYVLAFVNNGAYDISKNVQLYWLGARYTVIPRLDVTVAYYGVHQGAYGTGTEAGCTGSLYSVCSGGLEAFGVNADYSFNHHVDAYAGVLYSGVSNGLANGYAFNTTNLNPTIGIRIRF
jgi:predicted porin